MSDLSKYQNMILEHTTVKSAIDMFAPYGYHREKLEITAGRFKMFEPREWQVQPINDLVDGNSIIVQAPVGAGKSIVLQNAIARSRKVAYIIMPTIALSLDMKDRFDELDAKVGVWSSVTPKRDKDDMRANLDSYHAIILAPESMDTVPVSYNGILIIDEAHNISMSVNYRSSFSLIGKFRHKIKARCVGLFSATLNDEILHDIQKQFFDIEFNEYRDKNPDRDNLQYHTPIKLGYSMNLIYNLLEENAKNGRSAIIYAFSRQHIENMYLKTRSKLEDMGYDTMPFHSKIKDKNGTLDRFMENQSVVFATSAFGEGIDKKDVGLIIRIGYPFSITQLVQEAGRAERGLEMDGNYYMFRLGDEKRMFLMNCFSYKEVLNVFDKLSTDSFTSPETKNYVKDSSILTFLELEGLIQSRTENQVYHKIKVLEKDSSKRPYHFLLKNLKRKVNWHTDELDEMSDDWKKYLKNAKASDYIEHEAPSSKKKWKANVSNFPEDIKYKIEAHNDKVMVDYHEINEFFNADDKKKFLKDYFEGR